MLWRNRENDSCKKVGFASKCNGRDEYLPCRSCRRHDKNYYTSFYVDLRGSCVNYLRQSNKE